MSRLIDEIILHCSATKEGVNFTSDSVNAAHKARKFSTYVDSKTGKTLYIGYHFYIRLDGTIEKSKLLGELEGIAVGFVVVEDPGEDVIGRSVENALHFKKEVVVVVFFQIADHGNRPARRGVVRVVLLARWSSISSGR